MNCLLKLQTEKQDAEHWMPHLSWDSLSLWKYEMQQTYSC